MNITMPLQTSVCHTCQREGLLRDMRNDWNDYCCFNLNHDVEPLMMEKWSESKSFRWGNYFEYYLERKEQRHPLLTKMLAFFGVNFW